MSISFRIEALSDQHTRSEFHCGSEPLDRYFREQVTQDIRRRATLCYVAVAATGKVAGYYTLAASGVPLSDLTDDLIKRLPRYPLVPVARIGRLAVDENFRGKQLGAALLWDAAMRAARSEMAVFALVVDAKDATADTFYRHHGLIAVGNSGRQFLFPLPRLKALG